AAARAGPGSAPRGVGSRRGRQDRPAPVSSALVTSSIGHGRSVQDVHTHSLGPGPLVIGVLIVALYAVPLAFNLPLIDPDEGLHATISTEMLERGDFVVPRFLGQPFLDKPILFFFSQAVSLSIFGINEFAIRFPGQLFGL